MSGLDAVKRIVESEGQARKLVDEAKSKAQEIVTRAREDANKIKEEAIAQAQGQREMILKAAREKAETEARQSDVETERMLQSYGKLSAERRASAADKAVELILGT